MGRVVSRTPKPNDGVYRGRTLVGGIAAGPVISLDEPLSFWGGMDAATVKQILGQSPIREFHVGRGVRQPATVDGEVVAARVKEWLRYLET